MIESFATGTYEVKRPIANGAYVGGIYQPSATETIQVAGSLQPLTAKESVLYLKTNATGNHSNSTLRSNFIPRAKTGFGSPTS